MEDFSMSRYTERTGRPPPPHCHHLPTACQTAALPGLHSSGPPGFMGIEEGEEVQAVGISNIFNKIITGNSPNLEKTMPIQVQEASRTPNRLHQNRTTS
jgi:hypothetical protein